MRRRGRRRHTPLRGTIAGRLWTRLAEGRAEPGLVAALNAALVLLADHDLAPSTFAARIAASVRADPYAVVSAGLGPVSGVLHGRASRAARQLLDAAAVSDPRPPRPRREDLGYVPGLRPSALSRRRPPVPSLSSPCSDGPRAPRPRWPSSTVCRRRRDGACPSSRTWTSRSPRWASSPGCRPMRAS